MNVDPIETLLKQYKDKDLIHYARGQIDRIMAHPFDENLSAEANLVMREQALAEPFKILRAVDARMNKTSDDPKVVL